MAVREFTVSVSPKEAIDAIETYVVKGVLVVHLLISMLDGLVNMKSMSSFWRSIICGPAIGLR